MFSALIDKLMRREDLTSEEAAAAMGEVMEGRAADAQIAGLLVGLAMKGERPAEIVGLARTMRAHAVQRLPPVRGRLRHLRHRRRSLRHLQHLLRRGAGRRRLRVSGSRSTATGRCRACAAAPTCSRRSACKVTAPPDVVERCLAEAGIGFFFAPTFHPSMRHAGPTRRALGVRTAFNLLGPLTNPAGASRQLVGVPRPEFTELLARSLLLLGSKRAWVVHGADGIDEISTTGYTKISECRDGSVNTFYLHPADVGLPKATQAAIRGGDCGRQRAHHRTVLAGERGPARDIVVLNAGAALFIAGKAASIEEGMAQAAGAIDRGDAARTLERLAALSMAGESTAGAGA